MPRPRRFLSTILGGLALLFPPGQALGQVTLEYVGHACFVVQSPSGARIVIDPFNTNRWLGYHFPQDISADAVLVTHPHYDHDADYYFPERIPHFRLAGSYRVADIELRGVNGKHADPYGAEFGQQNTLWMIKTGGYRIAHLGDSGPLTQAMASGLGEVDILLIPVDDQDHILTRAQIGEIRRQLKPKITIPMHFRLETISDLPGSVGPITNWLGEQTNVERRKSNILALERGALSGKQPAVVAMAHSPALRPWEKSLREAWDLRDRARALSGQGQLEEAVALLTQARALAPTALVFAVEWAEASAQHDGPASVAGELRAMLAGADRADREYVMRARVLLAQAELALSNSAAALVQARIVTAEAWRTELRLAAEQVISAVGAE